MIRSVLDILFSIMPNVKTPEFLFLWLFYLCISSTFKIKLNVISAQRFYFNLSLLSLSTSPPFPLPLTHTHGHTNIFNSTLAKSQSLAFCIAIASILFYQLSFNCQQKSDFVFFIWYYFYVSSSKFLQPLVLIYWKNFNTFNPQLLLTRIHNNVLLILGCNCIQPKAVRNRISSRSFNCEPE